MNRTALESLRGTITQLLAEAPESDGAYVHAMDLLAEADLTALPSFRLAILRSFTIEPIRDVRTVRSFLEGVRLELFLGEFNQYQQELLDPASRLYRFKPEAVFLAVRLEELCPSLCDACGRLTTEERTRHSHEVLETVSGWLEQLHARGIDEVILSNFLVPAAGAEGLADTQTAEGQVSMARALNAGLVPLRERFPHLRIFDLEHLAGAIGKRIFCDPLQGYRMANPYRLSVYPSYGERLLLHTRLLSGMRRKCLVLDLDGTLWGGVLGEEGMEGVALSDTYPGNCFKEFQRALLQLTHRGILLAINSKNHAEDALAMIRAHPNMVLREEHFSALRINWHDKAENLRDIARELNLGLDALVFMDDSAVECAWVRQACPEVLVVHLPEQPHVYRTILEGLPCFEQLAVTAEDRARRAMYREQGPRRQLATQAGTLDDFYAGLQMQGRLTRNERATIQRVAQMTQKTNQFNLTTRRYTEAEIARFMDEGFVYALQVQDRFGDNGIVAAAVVVPVEGGARWAIDSFLMSCRVIMRTIEDALLAQIAEDARSAGIASLIGIYRPTPKNDLVKAFYRERGFAVQRVNEQGEATYTLDLASTAGPRPSPWLALILEAAHRP
jgi:FkbH-like protein